MYSALREPPPPLYRDCAASGCPTGSACFNTDDGGTICFKTCTAASQCRVAEGYTCDSDYTCFPTSFLTPTPTPNLALGHVGDACQSPADCADSACFDLRGGYCTRLDCVSLGCPPGSKCFNLNGGGSACYKSCTSGAQCRSSEGYICDSDNTCYVR